MFVFISKLKSSYCFVIDSVSRSPASVASKLVMSRVPTPPPNGEMSSGPVAESWCYTQVSAELQVQLKAF